MYSTQFDTLPIGKVSKSKIAVEGDNLSKTYLDSQATEKWTRAK